MIWGVPLFSETSIFWEATFSFREIPICSQYFSHNTLTWYSPEIENTQLKHGNWYGRRSIHTYMYVAQPYINTVYICICTYTANCRLFKPRVLFKLSLNTQNMCKMCTARKHMITYQEFNWCLLLETNRQFAAENSCLEGGSLHPSLEVKVHRNQSFRCLRPTVLAPSCDALNLGFPTTGWNSDAWIETYMDEIWCHVVTWLIDS